MKVNLQIEKIRVEKNSNKEWNKEIRGMRSTQRKGKNAKRNLKN